MVEFSHRTRERSLERFKSEVFDLLIVGGGITGAATARDAASRGLKVALVEARDFAWGTSSRSSKLIHGGIRYLENMEFRLVFEALSERANLLKTVPNVVKPIPFYFPIYSTDRHSRFVISLGLWLYDILALFRSPGFHKYLSRKKMTEEIHGLKAERLKGGFRYFDASMWDDVLTVEILRSASEKGAAVANYVEATAPIWKDERVVGFHLKNKDPYQKSDEKIEIRAHKIVSCAGPWTDLFCETVQKPWRTWLNPSKGVHLVFDLKKLNLPGALVMNHPSDGRIAFVIPRPDLGAGVTIVGTTDGPSPVDPAEVSVTPEDIDYLLRLLNNYFPENNIQKKDVLSAYAGVRPLMGAQASAQGSEGQASRRRSEDLQKVSREHYIGKGPGGVIVVAGGKYTTHRTMAGEIVDAVIKDWKRDFKRGVLKQRLPKLSRPSTREAINPNVQSAAVEMARKTASEKGLNIPEKLYDRYGADAIEVFSKDSHFSLKKEGFPCLRGQLEFAVHSEMALRLEDFYFRRSPLFMCSKDGGAEFSEELSEAWTSARGLSSEMGEKEREALKAEINRRMV